MSIRGGKRDGAGRPKGSLNRATIDQKARLADIARQHSSAAIDALVDVLENGQSENARISAAIAILDRGYGKPARATNTQMTPKDEDALSDLISIF